MNQSIRNFGDEKMKTFSGHNFANVYKEVLYNAINNPDYVVAPQGKKTHELHNIVMEIFDPRQNLFENSIQSPSIKYLAGELAWYLSGSNSLEFIRNYSKFWEEIACTDGTCNSAYGYLLFNEKNEHGFTEWGWALRALRQDMNTRQAIIRFNKPKFSYLGNKDFVCTLNGQFMIRNNKLYLTIVMRSNDLRTGVQYDVPFFTTLQCIMWKQLLPNYPNLQLGTYMHFVNSIHLYEKDFAAARKAINEEYISKNLPEIDYLLPITESGTPSYEYANLVKGIVYPNIPDAFYKWISWQAEITKIQSTKEEEL